jgi:hypothetical protein
MEASSVIPNYLLGAFESKEAERKASTEVSRRRCICGKSECKDLMKDLAHLAPDRARWMKFPYQPSVSNRCDMNVVDYRERRRRKFITSLGLTESSSGVANGCYMAIHHIHPSILNTTRDSSTWRCEGRVPEYISMRLGQELNYPHELLDPVSHHTYMVVPSYPLSRVRDDIDMLKAAHNDATTSHRASRQEKQLTSTFGIKPAASAIALEIDPSERVSE